MLRERVRVRRQHSNREEEAMLVCHVVTRKTAVRRIGRAMRPIRRGLPTAAVTLAACGTSSAVTPPPPPGDSLIFADEFSAANLDRTKWQVFVTGQVLNDEEQAYIDSEETIRIVHGEEAGGAADGALLITARYRQGFPAAGRSFDFISGRINTQGLVSFRYGTAAARIKLPSGAGLWPAFWLLGNEAWPETGEIDVMESVGDSSWVSVALHGPGYSGNTPLVQRTTLPPHLDATEWHVYAVDWSADSIVFRVDSMAIYRVGRSEVEQYGPWAFSNAKHIILNLALGGGYPAAVNGVRAPYPGLPETTVRRVQDGHARLLVDWVRVTQPRS
jgi:beta-glucanase (GH16 family)